MFHILYFFHNTRIHSGTVAIKNARIIDRFVALSVLLSRRFLYIVIIIETVSIFIPEFLL